MTLCHGSGDLANDGCCWVDGRVCPLRWKLVDGRILEGPDLTDRGTVDAFVASVVNGRPRQDRVKAQLVGVTFVCRAAAEVLAEDASLLTNRAAFEAAWVAHPRYQAEVRPAWERVEQSLGLEPGGFDCPRYRGNPGQPMCCFAESPAENAAKAQPLSAQAVQVRQAGGT